MRKIFSIQRVCRRSRDVIASSPEIQIKVFLRLRNDAPNESWALEIPSENSLGRPFPDKARFQMVDAKTKAMLYRPVALNPLLQMMPSLVYRGSAARICHLHGHREMLVMNFPKSHFGNHSSFLRTYITDPPCYTANAEISASYGVEEHSSHGAVRGGDIKSDQGLNIGDVILARTDVWVYQEWDDTLEVEAYTCTNSRLEEIMQHDLGPFITGKDMDPTLVLWPSGVVIPEDEEWHAVSAQPVSSHGKFLLDVPPEDI